MARVTVRRSDAHDLPPVCCVCGKPAARTRPETFRRAAGWVSWALLLCGLPWLLPDLFPRPSYAHSVFSVACAVPWLAGLVLARRSATLDLPVCDRHRRRRKRAWWVLGVGLLLAVAVGCSAEVLATGSVTRGDLIAGSFLFGLSALVVAVGLVDDRVRAAGIDDRTVTLDRVSEAFAEAVTSGERGPTRRAPAAAGGMELATARYYRG
jgi:hypothetical protein